MVKSDVVTKTDCLQPCSYNNYELVDAPIKEKRVDGGLKLRFAVTEGQEERELLLYGFVSFVSEFGGALGLFLGLSFLSLWDVIENVSTRFNKYLK